SAKAVGTAAALQNVRAPVPDQAIGAGRADCRDLDGPGQGRRARSAPRASPPDADEVAEAADQEQERAATRREAAAQPQAKAPTRGRNLAIPEDDRLAAVGVANAQAALLAKEGVVCGSPPPAQGGGVRRGTAGCGHRDEEGGQAEHGQDRPRSDAVRPPHRAYQISSQALTVSRRSARTRSRPGPQRTTSALPSAESST